MENKRNTWANVKKNLGIKLQTYLPPRGRQNWAVKGDQMQKVNYSQKQVARKDNTYHFAIEKEPFSKGPRSHPSLSNDNFYNTPKMICQEKFVQPPALSMGDRNSNNLFQCSTNPFMSDYSPEKVRPKHLEPESFNDEKTSSSKFTVPDPNENKWNTQHSLDLGDAHRGEASGLPRRSPIPVLGVSDNIIRE